MRRKRHKATRRALRFFRINHGFREPYKVLLDGNFVHALRETNLGQASDVIPKLLGARARVLTTRCVLNELKLMGPEFRAAAIDARRGAALHYCGHGGGAGDVNDRRRQGGGGDQGAAWAGESGGKSGGGKSGDDEPCLPAAACLASCVGPAGNAEHFIVATQDRALRAALGATPAGAAVFLTASGAQFEPPTERQKRAVAAVGAADRGAMPGERAGPGAGGGEPGGGGGYGGGGEALEEVARAARRAWARDTAVAFRRNRAKGPNPLSVKKKETRRKEAPATTKKKEKGAPAKKREEAPAAAAEGATAAAAKKEKAEVRGRPRRRKREGRETAAAAATASN